MNNKITNKAGIIILTARSRPFLTPLATTKTVRLIYTECQKIMRQGEERSSAKNALDLLPSNPRKLPAAD